MATLSNKITRSNQKRKNLEESITTLNQLILRPDITVKKKVLLKNYENVRKQNNTTTKVTSQTKVTNSPPNVTNLSKKVTNSATEVTNLKSNTGVKQKKEKSKTMADKLMVIQNVEFYPERGKRDVRVKKIKLQPKHDYKVVATTNKRKRGTPHRGIHSVPTFLKPPQQPTGPESTQSTEPLSLGSMLRLAEQQGLDDEDFMEILTCPSPVWWEDSDEDDSLLNDEWDWNNEKNKYTHATDKKVTIDSNGNKIHTENNSLKKFITKRSKLENILGKIKYKMTDNSKENNDVEWTIHGNISNEENILYIDGHLSNIDENIYNDREDNKGREEEDDCLEDENNVEESIFNNKFRNRKRKTSVGGLSDVSINEDELLYTLQSIELPVRDINKEQGVTNETTNDIVIMGIENNETDIKLTSNEKNRINDSKSKQTNKILQTKSKITVSNNVNNVKNDLNIPAELPILMQYPFRNVPKAYESPISIGSPNSDSTSVSELDSISDTNIKFLDEYVDEKKESEAVNINKYGEGKDGELVTVYQIVTNKPATDSDIEDQIKVNLVNKSPQSVNTPVMKSPKSNANLVDNPFQTDINSKNNEVDVNREEQILELRKDTHKNKLNFIAVKKFKNNNDSSKNQAENG